jgi:sodium/potassium-transporting ATPase subunit alpha
MASNASTSSDPAQPQSDSKGKGKDDKTKQKSLDITEHLFPIEEIAARHGVSIDVQKAASSKGLDSSVAAQRLAENGPNILSPPKQISPFMKFIHCLTSLFNLLLILAGILNYVLLAVNPKENKVNVRLSFLRRGLLFFHTIGFLSASGS